MVQAGAVIARSAAGAAVGALVVIAVVLAGDLAGVGELVAGVVAGGLLALCGVRLLRLTALVRQERAEGVQVIRLIDPTAGSERGSAFVAVRE